jgi:anti-sigma factor ChrR (cupin superfamily)
MAHLSIKDPEFWTNCPASLKHLHDDFPKSHGEDSRMAYLLLGPERDDTAAVGCLRLAPGEVIPRHRHAGYRIEIVISGSLQVVDGPMMHPGDMMMTEPDEPYGPHIAGPDGCTTFEIMSNHRSVTHPYLETPDGPVAYDIGTVEGLRAFKEDAAKLRPSASQA